MIGVAVGNGCLKRSGDGPSGGSSGTGSKKVTFSYVEMEDSGEKLAADTVSTRACNLKHAETCSSGEDVAGEMCADPPETQSLQRNTSSLCADSEVESQHIVTEAEEDVKVERRAAGIKRKKKTLQSSENFAANAQAGISRRSTRSSGFSADDVLLSPIVKSIETNSSCEYVAEEMCADPPETEFSRNTSSLCADSEFECQNILTEAEEDVKVERRAVGIKRKKKILQSSKDIGANAQRTRSSGLSGDEILLCPIVKSIGTNSSCEYVAGEMCADPPETEFSRNTSSLCADSEFECQNILTEAEEDVKGEGRACGIKRKKKTLQSSKNIAANAQAGVSRRCTRSSGLPAGDVLLSPIVDKKRKRRTAALGVDKKSAQVQDLHTEVSPAIIESEEHCKLLVQKSGVTGPCLVNATAVLHVIVEDNKMQTETVQLDSEPPAAPTSDVPRNDAPI